MDLESITAFFGWCTIINLAFLVWWFAFFTLGHDWLYRVHGKMFKISPETFDSIHYLGMALFKLGILLLNVSPYLALLIIRSR